MLVNWDLFISTFSPLPIHSVICKTAKWQDVGKDFHTYLFPGSRILFRHLQIISYILVFSISRPLLCLLFFMKQNKSEIFKIFWQFITFRVRNSYPYICWSPWYTCNSNLLSNGNGKLSLELSSTYYLNLALKTYSKFGISNVRRILSKIIINWKNEKEALHCVYISFWH